MMQESVLTPSNVSLLAAHDITFKMLGGEGADMPHLGTNSSSDSLSDDSDGCLFLGPGGKVGG